jgi:hypothetical protein
MSERSVTSGRKRTVSQPDNRETDLGSLLITPADIASDLRE